MLPSALEGESIDLSKMPPPEPIQVISDEQKALDISVAALRRQQKRVSRGIAIEMEAIIARLQGVMAAIGMMALPHIDLLG